MKKQLLIWYKSDSKIKSALALFIMTIFMIAYIDIKAIKRTAKAIDPDHSTKLFWDIFLTDLIFGFEPSNYAEYHFQGKSIKQRLTFLSFTEMILFSRSINLQAKIEILDKKQNTYAYFKEYFHRDQIAIKTEADKSKYEEFIQKHPTFFAKPSGRASGHGARIVNTQEQNKDQVFTELISQGEYILEERIIQCQEMAQFNPTSINTIRTALINTEDGIQMLFAELRTGRKGSIVDNGGSGGVLVPIDINTGKLCKYGFDNTGKTYTAHPDSNITFVNFQIPRWNEILQLSKELMEKIPNLKYVGWDISITDQGLTIVEGNSRAMFGGLQGLHQEGFKQELRHILRENKIPESFRTKQQEIFQ